MSNYYSKKLVRELQHKDVTYWHFVALIALFISGSILEKLNLMHDIIIGSVIILITMVVLISLAVGIRK